MKIGDAVFFMSKNKIYRGNVVDVSGDACKTLVKIKYDEGYGQSYHYPKIKECFSNAMQLIKFLSKNIEGI